MTTIVPLSAIRQNSRNGKYIRTSIADRNLQHLSKFVTRKLQEELYVFPGKIRPSSEFNASTYC